MDSQQEELVSLSLDEEDMPCKDNCKGDAPKTIVRTKFCKICSIILLLLAIVLIFGCFLLIPRLLHCDEICQFLTKTSRPTLDGERLVVEEEVIQTLDNFLQPSQEYLDALLQIDEGVFLAKSTTASSIEVAGTISGHDRESQVEMGQPHIKSKVIRRKRSFVKRRPPRKNEGIERNFENSEDINRKGKTFEKYNWTRTRK